MIPTPVPIVIVSIVSNKIEQLHATEGGTTNESRTVLNGHIVFLLVTLHSLNPPTLVIHLSTEPTPTDSK